MWFFLLQEYLKEQFIVVVRLVKVYIKQANLGGDIFLTARSSSVASNLSTISCCCIFQLHKNQTCDAPNSAESSEAWPYESDRCHCKRENCHPPQVCFSRQSSMDYNSSTLHIVFWQEGIKSEIKLLMEEKRKLLLLWRFFSDVQWMRISKVSKTGIIYRWALSLLWACFDPFVAFNVSKTVSASGIAIQKSA